jgi:hypothetical protein
MARPSLPRRVTYLRTGPAAPGARHLIESTFDVGRRFRCRMRVERSQLDPAAVNRGQY